MKKHLPIITLLFSFLVFSQSTVGNVVVLNGEMTVKLDTNNTTATLTLTGPSTSWLGLGFGGTSMSTVSDMFIWSSTANRDYTPSGGTSTPSADASQNWTITSDAVTGTTRTIVATRNLVSAGDFTFTNDATPIQIIANRGSSTTLGYHGFNTNRTVTNITRAVLGVNDIKSKEAITLVYPNPAKDFFEIKSSQTLVSVNVYDATGKMVSNFSAASKEYNVAKLENGIYFLEITTKDGETHFEKLIKN